MVSQRKSLCFAAMLFVSALPTVAHASWWNADWQFRKRLNIDAAIVTTSALAGVTEVSVPIRELPQPITVEIRTHHSQK